MIKPFFTAGLVAPGSTGSGGNGPANTTRKVELQSDNTLVPSTQTDVPLLINRAALPNEMFDPSGGNKAQSDGGDIRVSSDSAGTNLLPCEVVEFGLDSVTDAGDGLCEIWVKVSSLSGSAATSIWVWYSSSTGTETQPAVTEPEGRNAVWSGCVHVYHMKGSAPLTDSTGNNNIGANGTPTEVSGKIGKAQRIDQATGEYFDVNDGATGDVSLYTIVVWLKTTDHNDFTAASGGDPQIVSRDDNSQGFWVGRINSDMDYNLRFATNGGNIQFAYPANNNFNMIACAQHSATDARCFVNGALDNSGDNGWIGVSTTQIFRIGRKSSLNEPLEGDYDEVQYWSSALPNDFITASYNNQNAPGTFWATQTPQAA